MYVPDLCDRVAGSPALRRRQSLVRALVPLLGRVAASGLARVPPDGPVLLAVNHRCALDGPLVFALVSRPASFLVKSEAFVPGLAPWLTSAGQIAVHRDRVDAAAVRQCVQVLRAGGVVGIFPEGRRGDGRVDAIRPGVAYLALRSGAAVVPVACHGTPELTHRRGVGRPHARIALGAPLPVERWPDHTVLPRRIVQAESERIRAALAAHVLDTVPSRVRDTEVAA